MGDGATSRRDADHMHYLYANYLARAVIGSHWRESAVRARVALISSFNFYQADYVGCAHKLCVN